MLASEPPVHVAANCSVSPSAMTELCGVILQLIVAASADPLTKLVAINAHRSLLTKFIALPFRIDIAIDHEIPHALTG
jgi:hypothetical protein